MRLTSMAPSRVRLERPHRSRCWSFIGVRADGYNARSFAMAARDSLLRQMSA